MTKKDKPKEREQPEICWHCKHRKAPNGKLPIRGWCGNPQSMRYDGYIFKGDTCAQFSSKVKKGKPDKEMKKRVDA